MKGVIFIENITVTNADMRIETLLQSFDMQEIINRRFMFNPLTGTLILGRQYSGNQIVASHAEEHGRVAEGEPFDDFIRGWVGTGGSYKNGIIHFAPPIPKGYPDIFDKGFSTLEMFAVNGANGDTVIRGFSGAWEQPLSNIIDGLNTLRKELIIPMADMKNTFEASNYGDTLEPADRLKIERHIYFQDDKTDISRLTVLPVERLQALRAESAAAEKAIYDSLRGQADFWDNQAAVTLLIDKAIEYVKVPAAVHSSNQWGRDNANSDRQSMSNMVYKMAYHVNEKTSYDRAAQKSVPVGYELKWDIYTNNPGGRRFAKVAGQDKTFSDKADMDKYLAGRIKAYAHLFTEISPPIPPEYKKGFSVNGQLLPGYTIQGEKPQARAADMGGVSVVDQKLTELLRKEHEEMNEPLNIKLSTREQYEAGGVEGAWLKLPATAEQLNAALARIGARDKDFIITGIESPIAAVARLSLENAQSAGIDTLNFLAAGLEKLDDTQIEKLNAAIESMPELEDVRRLAEFPQNTDYYLHIPDIKDYAQLGAYYLHDSKMVDMPEAWKDAVDTTKLGMIAVEKEKGAFTERGYVIETGDKWEPVAEIPKEYRISPPAVEQDTITNRTAATVTAKPPERTQTAAVNEAKTPAQAKPAPIIPIVLTAENPRDRMKEITDKLENGIKGIFNSDNYRNYLQTLSKFHNYSFNNCILIAMQNPAATRVAGFNAWRDDFKRPVMKGEKGIKILAPAPFKTKKTVDAVDVNGKPVYDSDGRRKKEETEITVPAFKIVSVFDVSQTDGEPLPQIGVDELTGSVERYKELFAALEKTSPVPVAFEAINTGAKGYYSQDEKRIAINEGMSELQSLKTLIHEIAHSRLHDIDKNVPITEPRPDRDTREVQAESIAFAVCARYGLDTSDYSFGYVATWSGDKQLDMLKASLDTIRKEADAIITEVDKHFSELSQGMEQTAERPAPERQQEQTPQGGTFTIYQLKGGDDTRSLRNESLAAVTAAGLAVALSNYDNVYTAPLDKDMSLDDIHFTFNMEHPEDFKGHSLSVSDVVVMNRDGKETAFYVDGAGFKELPDFLTPIEQAQEKPAPAVDLKIVADYMQKQYDAVQAADPDKAQGQAAFSMAVKRLERANERIPDNQPQLKALISNAAQSPDLATLKERMQTMNTEFIQHYSTAVQMTIDTGSKAEPKAPAVKQTEKADAPPAPKAPAQGENVAAIENKVKAGEVINLSDLSEAIKKDKAAAQTAPQTPAKQTRTNTQGKGAAGKDEQPSIKEKIAAGRQEIAAKKSAPAKTAAKNQHAAIGG